MLGIKQMLYEDEEFKEYLVTAPMRQKGFLHVLYSNWDEHGSHKKSHFHHAMPSSMQNAWWESKILSRTQPMNTESSHLLTGCTCLSDAADMKLLLNNNVGSVDAWRSCP